MLDAGLDISIQDRVVNFKNISHALISDNYFLVHKWKRDDLSYSLYTEVELRLHKTFGNPSVNALLNFLSRTSSE